MNIEKRITKNKLTSEKMNIEKRITKNKLTSENEYRKTNNEKQICFRKTI